MSWYKFSTDYIALVKSRKQNSIIEPQMPTEPAAEAKPMTGLESALEATRANEDQNPFLMNEIRQPVRTKATGQGADYLLQANQDLAVYRGDVFQEFDR